MKEYYLYIISNYNHTVFYIGMTNNLERRMIEHKEKLVPGFSQRYNCTKLLYFECGSSVQGVIEREKQLKGWKRKKKIDLIKTINPSFDDLAKDWG